MNLSRDYGRYREAEAQALESGNRGRAIKEKKSIRGKVQEKERSNSCAMVEETTKRKKESAKGGVELFKKNNKTQRTPESVEKAEERGIEEILKK